ncbi:hypothetical protein ISCGN_009392, partial [Ixodes scapularis]
FTEKGLFAALYYQILTLQVSNQALHGSVVELAGFATTLVAYAQLQPKMNRGQSYEPSSEFSALIVQRDFTFRASLLSREYRLLALDVLGELLASAAASLAGNSAPVLFLTCFSARPSA